ncbi:MAG: hypothetical protein ACRD3Q_11375 [Terriglobales bacterium]
MKTGFHRLAAMLAIGLAAPLATSHVATSVLGPVRVPFRLVGPSSPLVTIRIQKRDIPLELDIGDASSLVLHPAVLSELNTTPTGELYKGYGIEGRVIEEPVVKVDRVEIGGIVFSDVSIHKDDHDDAFRAKQLAERGTQGYIGAGFFKGYEIVLDYPRRRITLIPHGAQPTSQNSCRGRVIPLERSVDWGLVSRVNTELGDMLFVWDTGSPGLVMVKAHAQAAHLDITHGAVTFKHFRMNGREFGPLQFDLWDVAAPPRMAGFIGYDFFRDHVVCIDFPRNRILVR